MPNTEDRVRAVGETALECSECGRFVGATELREVDGKPVCIRCLFGDAPALGVWPIGVVRNSLAGPGTGVQICRTARSEIHLVPGMIRFLSGVSDETSLTVVWWAHLTHGLETTFERGLDGKVVGPFAARTPARPNPLAITEVTLVEARGPVLVVEGLDAVDGTPVIDLKLGRGSIARALGES
ncbi:MAG TPA: TrmO family methyltransferase [Gemmatimonadaceae bacterium]